VISNSSLVNNLADADDQELRRRGLELRSDRSLKRRLPAQQPPRDQLSAASFLIRFAILFRLVRIPG